VNPCIGARFRAMPGSSCGGLDSPFRVLRWFARRGLLDVSATAQTSGARRRSTARRTPGRPVTSPAGVPPGAGRSRALGALLLARIYEVLPLLFPRGTARSVFRGVMGILALLADPPTVRGILLQLGLRHRHPPVTPTYSLRGLSAAGRPPDPRS